MITIRRASTLGTAHDGGVTFRCHFDFADWRSAGHAHEGRLRAVNQATLPPGATCRLGPETSMDIATWVAQGDVAVQVDHFPHEHIQTGGLHLISTGSGCSDLQWKTTDAAAAVFQFWFMADTQGDFPFQSVRAPCPAMDDGSFRILASGFAEDDPEQTEMVRDGSPVPLSSCARLLQATLRAGEGAAYQTDTARDLYLVVASGVMRIGNDVLMAGDAAAIEGENTLTVIAQENGIVLLVDVAR
ncbi:pirin family protein [Novacetimonas pomaceti]|uniref:Quercetin 2,3-dioxygenase C-terminal cupin domain-containing protein n=1 Tax=Novacetimonas pomaceti TaxID=2021998 RepID=A0A318QDR7_9PROT|nr:hypothetical protein [Novacetimonas pomaceti]PYD75462.1 hypothetical protein CFR71_09485 [Novacetimonas pomaceti]